MLASRQSDGLLGLDCSVDFSSAPLEHVFLVLHGLGDQYSDAPPWLTAFESSLAHLQRGVDSAHASTSARGASPAVLLVPLEYHAFAQRALSRTLQPAVPRASGPLPAVRTGISETVGDVLMAASPYFRDAVCSELLAQASEQLAAVRRARPAYTSGTFSIFAHSTGAVYLTHMLATGMLDGVDGLDAVVLAGGPVAAYAALDPEYADQLRLGIAERRRRGVRVVNVYHPLDPVSYRMQPWLAVSSASGVPTGDALPPVRVGRNEKQSIWEEVHSFWGDTFQNVMSTLFPKRVTEVPQQSQSRVSSSHEESPEHPSVRSENSGGRERAAGSPGSEAASAPPTSALRREKIYFVESGGPGGEGATLGKEALVGEHVDFELNDGMEAHSIDVVTNFAAVKAHGFYWRSQDVARILVDIALTSKSAS